MRAQAQQRRKSRRLSPVQLRYPRARMTLRSLSGFVALATVLIFVGCSRDHRLLLIGLDAANWDSMDGLLADGSLPNLHDLVKEGAAGSLATFVPTASCAIWTTIATGQPPDKHGILFRVLRLDEKGEHEMLSALSSDKRVVPALWNLCTNAGMRSAFVGWWATCPAESIDGFMVTDKVREPAAIRTTFPDELRAELDRAGMFDGALPPDQKKMIQEIQARFEAWRRGVEEGDIPWRGNAPDLKQYFDDLAERLRVYRRIMARDYGIERITRYLMDRDPSLRVIAPYFWYLDVCEHIFWKYWRPEGFVIDPEEQRIFAPLVPAYYRFLDGVVGRLRRDAGSASVVIVSDHGMASGTGDRCINDLFDVEGILEDMGWLVRNADGTPDLARSRAYVYAESRQLRLINLAVLGSDSGGAGPVRDLDLTRAALCEELSGLRATPSGEPVFKDVRVLARGEKSFRAKESVVYVFASGDLAATINLRVPLTDSLQVGEQRFPLTRWNRWEPGISGHHSEAPPGIVILHGAPFKRGVRLDGARVHDIGPTVLTALGLPVAEDLEGVVLTDAFSPRFLRVHPPLTVPSYGLRQRPQGTDAEAAEGEAALLEQLRAIGYIR